MWRTRAVRSMLLEDVAHLRGGGREEPPGIQELHRARTRALLMAAFDGAALAVLLLSRPDGVPFPAFGPVGETIFTLGVLAVAIHAGFRLGQWEKLRAVGQVIAELDERDPTG